jgi:hypothetical protein
VAFKTEAGLALKSLAERGFRRPEIAALKPGEYVMRDRAGSQPRGKVF